MASRSSSPAGSDSSSASRKRDRDNLNIDYDDEAARLRSGKLRAILQGINNITATQARHGELLKDIPALKSQLELFCKYVTELKQQYQTISADNTALKQEMSELKARVDAIQSSAASHCVAQDISRLEAVASTNAAHIQQVLARHNDIDELVISGFSFQLGQTHDVMALVSAVIRALKVELVTGDLISVRLMSKSPIAAPTPGTSSQSASASAAPVSQLIPVAVKCAGPGVVQKVLSAKRKHPILKISDLDADVIAAVNLSAANNKSNTIYVNELLPSRTFKLLGTARKSLKALGFKFVWCKGGTIFAKRSENDIVHTILTQEDVERIQFLHSHP